MTFAIDGAEGTMILLAVGLVVFLSTSLFIVWKLRKVFDLDFLSKRTSGSEKKRRIDPEVVLTDPEKRGMRKNIYIGAMCVAALLLLVSTTAVLEYSRFAIQGESVKATITNVTTTRSGGKGTRYRYVYTLSTTVNGKVLTDEYNAGKNSGGYTKGDVVDAYLAQSLTGYDLAIVNIVQRKLMFTALLVIAVGSAVAHRLRAQWKRILVGKAKISHLPKAFRAARRAQLQKN